MEEPNGPRNPEVEPDLSDLKIKDRRALSAVSGAIGRTFKSFRAALGPKLMALLVVAIIGLPAWLLGGKPTFNDVARWLGSLTIGNASETHFTILVADLADDESGTHTQDLVDVLQAVDGLRIMREPTALRVGTVGDASEDLLEAEARGQEWLTRRNADVLVWGRVSEDVLRVRVLPSEGQGGQLLGLPKFGAELELPIVLSEELGLQLVAVAVSRVTPATEESGSYLVAVLTPIATKLRNFLESTPSIVSEQRASLSHSLGLASTAIGSQSGESSWLVEAVAAYRAALEEYTRERVPLKWAKTQNNLGGALRVLGERESDTDWLEEAVAACRAALEERTRERVPLEWAGTLNNLGNALKTLGERESGTDRLEEAVAAYRAALETSEIAGAQWYIEIAQRNLERVLSLIQERQGG